MKGTINASGELIVERAGRMHAQYCPFTTTKRAVLGGGVIVERVRCGDWCPLFGEPQQEKDGRWLELCHGKMWHFDEITDER